MPQPHPHAASLKVVLAVAVPIFTAGGVFMAWNTSHPTMAEVRAETIEQLNEYDHARREPLESAPLPPRAGFAASREDHEQRVKALELQLERNRKLAIAEWRWTVRYRAADAEPHAKLRAQSVAAALVIYDARIMAGDEPDEAARRALETSPYER